MIGVVVAAVATRTMTTLLHGVTPLDPLTFAAVAAALSIIAAVASYIPAHAATRIDPLTALKAE